ncbi:bifunctional folylpolyglutamate synthase/dihydrofolate synthase [Thalassorhabdus alkalitolerans]|uniref:tetrahydrofolate synthase n=1 Tax=Thalassorhabdus alkalitolerans TaxID=2282697 RepID=A0ABW0YMM0_9BACI
MNTYEEAKEWLHSLVPLGIKPGLERVNYMLDALGNPERSIKSIQVGGTNGKGSTVTFLRYMMNEAGLEVGTFTSPYITHFRERISVNGHSISKEDFLEYAAAVKPLTEQLATTPLGAPTEFEVLTVIAALYFAKKAYPDVVIWEVGLGGRFDSTTAMHPMVSVITNVGHDHQHILGETIPEIAKEKAGIVKSGVPLVTCEEKPEALAIFKETVEQNRTKMYTLGKEFFINNNNEAETGSSFSFSSMFKHYPELRVEMEGEHQVKNAAAALMAIGYLKMFYALPVDDDHISNGLKKANWPGRFEIIQEKPSIILDGAHNKEGMESLAKALNRRYPDKTVHIIFAMTKEKNAYELLLPLSSLRIGSAFAAPFDFPRAASPAEIKKKSPFEMREVPNWQTAMEEAKKSASMNDVIVICGSLYFISEIKQ